MFTFTVREKEVTVYPAEGCGRPLICINTFAHEVKKIHRALETRQSPDCTLVAVTNLDWDHDMAPWDCPPISKMDTPCTGGADAYLRILIDEILPEAEKSAEGEPAWRGICGYSLAGLFAVYAIYQTDLFSRIASMSGSLWFPGFREYVFSHEMKVRPDHIYFSLGDKESKTDNSYLKTVQDNTGAIRDFYADHGIDSIFQLNPGNHYVNAEDRTAAGIDWILRK